MVGGSTSALAERLASQLEGEVLFDRYSRGRYATDASIYQMTPLGVVVPRNLDDVRGTISAARDAGIPVLPRGGGTSQCGQTVNEALVIDTSKYLTRILELDIENRRCLVEPGIVLDELNRALKPHGLWFPVDVSTSSRATIGGMTANNSCGSRSIRYGLMRDNVLAIDAILANGSEARFETLNRDFGNRTFGQGTNLSDSERLFQDLLALGKREATEIAARLPQVMRRVGGYNIDALIPGIPGIPGVRGAEGNNLAHLLVGSEGTLAYSSAIELKLSRLPVNKVLGICHFPTFHGAMDATQHLVTLGPTAVELIDRTMIELAREIPLYRATVDTFVRGAPEALLLVEFAEDDQAENIRRLKALGDMMGDLGFDWSHSADRRGGVVEAIDPSFQVAILEVRKSGLNIMMSMKAEGKPVSFVEDCAVELKDLADYTANLTAIFEKHGTMGTWYAHASVGCLHVRPVLNIRLDQDVKKMRAIATEAFDLVLAYKGSHSGEHGDGIARSEFHEKMFGSRMVETFRAVKRLFDPNLLFNPGKIVDPPKMDDRRLFRYAPDYKVAALETELDWSAWSGQGGGFQGAIEMCNNNGACRKLGGGAMCPSYRVTRNERDLTRGRANTLRLAISGQLGEGALTSAEMAETMKLCVGCKACKRECPTGVDMAKMKLEVSAARAKANGLSLHDRLVAWLPRYAPLAASFPWLFNSRDAIPGLSRLLETPTGFSRRRALPKWRSDIYSAPESEGPVSEGPADGKEVILFADTFNRYFESENLRAARKVLLSAGYRVLSPQATRSAKRPLCCGRTFLVSGLPDMARDEARRLIDTYFPYAERGVAIVGLEPSCLLTLRDELPVLLPGEKVETIAQAAVLFEEFLDREDLELDLKPLPRKALLHGHCHQKAFDAMGPIERTLRKIPDLSLETIESSCCGMAGAFGYATETYEVSIKMAELSLLPKIRAADDDTLLVADGTSCRQQIAHGSGRSALHVARVLEMALPDAGV